MTGQRRYPLAVLVMASASAIILSFAFVDAIRGAFAQEGAGMLRVGIIDAQRILGESSAMGALSDEIEKIRARHQATLRDGERVIREADRNLAIERPNLNPSVYAQKRRELELQATALQRDYQENMRNVDTSFRQGLAQIQQTLTLITQEIAANRNLDLVLAKATVVLVRPDLEFTDEALLQLNQRLPKVTLLGLADE